MCGVSGIIHHDGKQIPLDLLVRMNRTMAHRGPNEEGYYVNAGKLGGQEGQEAGKRNSSKLKGM